MHTHTHTYNSDTEITMSEFFPCRTVFFGQYKCLGPGAAPEARVPWSRELTYEEAEPFISLDFIDGNEWLSRT